MKPFALIVLVFAAFVAANHEDASVPSMDEIIEAALPPQGFYSDPDIVQVEMDMLYRKEDYAALMDETEGGRMKRNVERNTRLRWANKQIVYYIQKGVFTSSQITQIKKGMRAWENLTCLTFKERKSERNYVSIGNGRGCSSFVGMIGGRQLLSLDRGCFYHKTIVHEFGHAMGFQHEQTRPDRDSYVTIHKDNINPKNLFNFNKYGTSKINTFGVPYDYRSVMHYSAKAFSINGKNTITTKDKSFQNIIGRVSGLSFRDVKLANLAYNCNTHCSRKTCPGEGFQARDCKCYCPGSPLKLC